MATPVRAWLDAALWTEEERVNFWLHARMMDACGDESLATELVASGADYRQVTRAHEHGANATQLRRIFV